MSGDCAWVLRVIFVCVLFLGWHKLPVIMDTDVRNRKKNKNSKASAKVDDVLKKTVEEKLKSPPLDVKRDSVSVES